MSAFGEHPLDPIPNTYILDPNDDVEMVRLLAQHRFVTQLTGGLLPEQQNLANVHDMLDIACGAGGWVLDMAKAHPDIQLVGMDISTRMINYARGQALLENIHNARFAFMSALKPLDFADNSFDIINARFLFSFMLPAMWPNLLQECMRCIRPGGIIRITEAEFGISNSYAHEQFNFLYSQALKFAGQSFSPDGRKIGITPMIGQLLRQSGYHNVQQMAMTIDYSANTVAHGKLCYNYRVLLETGLPFLLQYGVTTREDFKQLFQQLMKELYADDFCAIQSFLTAWGQKPANQVDDD